MDPISIAIAVALLLAAYWPQIVDLFSVRIIPWVRESVSAALADVLAEMLVFLDKGVTSIRRPIKEAWKYFQRNFLGSKLEVTKTSATQATVKRTTLARDENGKLVTSVVTENLNWENLPPKIREEIIRQNATNAQMDLKKAVAENVQARARKEGVILEDTY
jgi:hypothetical protein